MWPVRDFNSSSKWHIRRSVGRSVGQASQNSSTWIHPTARFFSSSGCNRRSEFSSMWMHPTVRFFHPNGCIRSHSEIFHPCESHPCLLLHTLFIVALFLRCFCARSASARCLLFCSVLHRCAIRALSCRCHFCFHGCRPASSRWSHWDRPALQDSPGARHSWPDQVRLS